MRKVLSLITAVSVFTGLASPTKGEPELSIYRNDRYRFELSFPAAIFSPDGIAESDRGKMFKSRDGAARLLASAGPNDSQLTLEAYRQFVLNKSYSGARIDYAPVRRNWFVLSGTIGDKMFYERITLKCGGKVIYGWQMFYPAAERKLYDPVVEAVHRSYRPRETESVNCD